MIINLDDFRSVLGVSISVTDETLTQVAQAAENAILTHLRTTDDEGEPIDYSTVPEVQEVVLNASVEMFRYRTSPGGMFNAADVAPITYGLGRLFFERFNGPLSKWIEVEGIIG